MRVQVGDRVEVKRESDPGKRHWIGQVGEVVKLDPPRRCATVVFGEDGPRVLFQYDALTVVDVACSAA